MSVSPRVTPVRTAAEHRAFWALPYRLYRDTPTWPAPLRRDERRRWDPAYNPSLLGRRVWRFVAWQGRVAVGRVVAFLDPAFAARWSPEAGGFGFFESIDDVEVAAALFEATEGVLRAEGASHVLGPVNLTFHDEMGLLVQGFDAGPSFLTPFNPPYYGPLIERQGYRRRFDQHAYDWASGVTIRAAVKRSVAHATREGIVVRALRPDAWASELRLLHGLYNETFCDVWGFVPISWDDFRVRANVFRSFYRPELVLLADGPGGPVGFMLALPELSQLLARNRGRLWPFGAIRLALRAPAVRRVRVMLLGVLPSWRGSGTALALVADLVARARRLGIDSGELSLVHESNRSARHVLLACGGVQTKTFRLYEKPLV